MRSISINPKPEAGVLYPIRIVQSLKVNGSFGSIGIAFLTETNLKLSVSIIART